MVGGQKPLPNFLTTKPMEIQQLKETNQIHRRFIKMRGEYAKPYVYKTFAGILENNWLANDTLYFKLAQGLLARFLQDFEKRDLGCSNATEIIGSNIVEMIDHELVFYGQQSEFVGQGHDQHDIAQDWLLENDPMTLAVEVPVWNDERQGFIDIIRYNTDTNRIEIVDLKPNASAEKVTKVTAQLHHYRLMFCELFDIPADMVDCLYFDEKNCYKLIYS